MGTLDDLVYTETGFNGDRSQRIQSLKVNRVEATEKHLRANSVVGIFIAVLIQKGAMQMPSNLTLCNDAKRDLCRGIINNW